MIRIQVHDLLSACVWVGVLDRHAAQHTAEVVAVSLSSPGSGVDACKYGTSLLVLSGFTFAAGFLKLGKFVTNFDGLLLCFYRRYPLVMG